MSQFSDNLTAQRDKLGLSVQEVQEELNRRGFDVAYSTVAGWFNGSRRPRKMEHLNALLAVLRTDLEAMSGDEIEVVEGKVETALIREMHGLSDTQKEAVLALVRSIKLGA